MSDDRPHDDFVQDLIDTGEKYAPPQYRKETHPSKEWEPRVDTEKGEAVIRLDEPIKSGPNWDLYLENWGFDPELFVIDEDKVEVRTWDAHYGVDQAPKRFWYYKARITRRRSKQDLSDLISEIKSHRKTANAPPTGDASLIVALSDWQLGKKDGDGTAGTVKRILKLHDDLIDHVKYLRNSGVTLKTLYILGLGDIVEGCTGFYQMQEWMTEYDRREQTKIAWRLLIKLVQGWAPLFEEVVIAAVGGNHGENRKNGKAFTSFNDNDDVLVFEILHDVLKENPERYGHVKFILPTSELSITLDVGGMIVGMAHGHQTGARGGATAVTKVWEWWKNQSHSQLPVGDAELLITGHYHYLNVVVQGPKTHIQVPPLDGGSDWFVEKYGNPTTPGTVTLTVDESGWDNFKVL